MLKNLHYFKRKLQVEIFLKITRIICMVCIALILCPLAATNCKLIYADATDWFVQMREKLQVGKLPWE